MALPEGFYPYVTSARRYLFLAERERLRTDDDGPALAFRRRRLAAYGTPFPPDLPGRAQLIAGGVLALEEVRGAGVDELRTYGLSARQAESLITRLETDPELAVPDTFQSGPNAGQQYDTDPITLDASATVTTTGNGGVYELGDKATLRLALDVTAISGTGASLHVQVQTKNNASDPWRTLGAFPVASAIGVAYLSVPGCDRYVRTQHTVAGSGPSVTFSVSGNAV